MNRGRRLRAPRDDGGVRIDPPWPQLVALAKSQLKPKPPRDYDVQGKPLDELAQEARAEILDEALSYARSYRDVSVPSSAFRVPRSALVLAGHQPELFHPGVWAKNFALSALAKTVGGTAVNLVVDGDVLERPTLRVPTGSINAPRIEEVPFDRSADLLPYEERCVFDVETFRTFGRRAVDVLKPLVAGPLLETFWPTVVDELPRDGLIGAATARARHRLEGVWGLETLELPQSRLCETRSFRRFVAHLSANLPRFHEAYNGALDEYRRVEHVRSAGRPVPPLGRHDDAWEIPLWIWTAEAPQRRRAFVRSVGRETELLDQAGLVVRLPSPEVAIDATVAALGELYGRGVRLRSRALLTTMYARFVLDAPFIHGIGGGKYDELTDEIVRRFFGLEPPPFAVVTATRQLPIARPRPVGDDPATLRHRLWQLDHHPETFFDATISAEATRLTSEKRRLLSVGPPAESAREWCQAIRAVNAKLRPYVAELRRKNEARLGTTCRQRADEGVLASREYSSFLFPEKDLRDFLLAIAPS